MVVQRMINSPLPHTNPCHSTYIAYLFFNELPVAATISYLVRACNTQERTPTNGNHFAGFKLHSCAFMMNIHPIAIAPLPSSSSSTLLAIIATERPRLRHSLDILSSAAHRFFGFAAAQPYNRHSVRIVLTGPAFRFVHDFSHMRRPGDFPKIPLPHENYRKCVFFSLVVSFLRLEMCAKAESQRMCEKLKE